MADAGSCTLADGCIAPNEAGCVRYGCLATERGTEWQQRIDQSRDTQSLPIGPTIDVPAERGFYVYVHLDAEATPLYVGQTTNPACRVANHVLSKRSHWWPLVRSITWLRVSNEHAMCALETQLIHALCPRHNINQAVA